MLRIKRALDRVLAPVLVALMSAMVLAVLWQIVTRYVFSSPSSWTEEFARYVMIWIGLLGGAYAVGQRIHLSVDLIQLKGRGQGVLIQSSILVFATLVLVIGGVFLVRLSLELGQTSPALSEALGVDVRMGFIYAALPLSGALTVFYALCELLHPAERDGQGEDVDGGAGEVGDAEAPAR